MEKPFSNAVGVVITKFLLLVLILPFSESTPSSVDTSGKVGGTFDLKVLSFSITGQQQQPQTYRLWICARQYDITTAQDLDDENSDDIFAPLSPPDQPSPFCLIGRNGNNGSSLSSSITNGDLVSVSLPFDFAWPGRFSLIIEVRAQDVYTAVGGETEPTTTTTASSASTVVLSDDSQDTSVTSESPRGQLLLRSVIADRDFFPSSGWRIGVLNSTGVELQLEYQVTCSPYNFGSKCMARCVPRDDRFGHYSCDSNGAKSCLPGWTGVVCDQPICLTGCNETNGGCNQPGECRCKEGWTGELCDQCVPPPGCSRANGGYCVKPGECRCANADWTGPLCDMETNPCARRGQRCVDNGGMCNNIANGYTCKCPSWRSGRDCEIRTVGCSKQLCRNGATCSDVESDPGFLCFCPRGFNGQFCEKLNLTTSTTGATPILQPNRSSQALPVVAPSPSGCFGAQCSPIAATLMTGSPSAASAADLAGSLSTVNVALIVVFGVGLPCFLIILASIVCSSRLGRRFGRKRSGSGSSSASSNSTQGVCLGHSSGTTFIAFPSGATTTTSGLDDCETYISSRNRPKFPSWQRPDPPPYSTNIAPNDQNAVNVRRSNNIAAATAATAPYWDRGATMAPRRLKQPSHQPIRRRPTSWFYVDGSEEGQQQQPSCDIIAPMHNSSQRRNTTITRCDTLQPRYHPTSNDFLGGHLPPTAGQAPWWSRDDSVPFTIAIHSAGPNQGRQAAATTYRTHHVLPHMQQDSSGTTSFTVLPVIVRSSTTGAVTNAVQAEVTSNIATTAAPEVPPASTSLSCTSPPPIYSEI